MAYIQVYNIRADRASCIVTDLDPTYERDDRTVRWILNGANIATKPIAAYTPSGGGITFEGLTASSDYTVTATVSYTDGEETQYVVLTASFTTVMSSPAPFRWGTAKVKGAPFSLTVSEWSFFCDNINAVRVYMGLARVSFTVPVKGSPFTAAQYNEARIAIAEMGAGELLPAAVRGAPITADALNGIVEALNGI